MYCYRTLQIHTAMPFHCNSTCHSLILLADVHKSLLLYHYFLIAFLYWKCTDDGTTTSSFMSSCTFTFICANRNSVFQSRISNRVFHKQTWLQTVFFIYIHKSQTQISKDHSWGLVHQTRITYLHTNPGRINPNPKFYSLRYYNSIWKKSRKSLQRSSSIQEGGFQHRLQSVPRKQA